MTRSPLQDSGEMIIFSDSRPPQAPSKPPLHEVLSRLILPTLFAVAAILGRSYHAILFSFFGVALLGIYYEQLASIFRHIRVRKHDTKVAKEGLKELRRFSRDFGEFFETSTSRTDMLPGIMNELRIRHPELGDALLFIPAPDIFRTHWEFVNSRIQDEDFTPAQFHAAAKELWSIIACYNSYCVCPVFRTFAYEIRDTLKTHEKSPLNAFQQRFGYALTNYITYLKQLNEDFCSLPELPIGMAYPHPI